MTMLLVNGDREDLFFFSKLLIIRLMMMLVTGDGEDLNDAIGVLGGGWFSLPLLTGQRRSANISLSSHYSHILFYCLYNDTF